nr:uncharacterized protein LOC127339156 [Lolium perenne]
MDNDIHIRRAVRLSPGANEPPPHAAGQRDEDRNAADPQSADTPHVQKWRHRRVALLLTTKLIKKSFAGAANRHREAASTDANTGVQGRAISHSSTSSPVQPPSQPQWPPRHPEHTRRAAAPPSSTAHTLAALSVKTGKECTTSAPASTGQASATWGNPVQARKSPSGPMRAQPCPASPAPLHHRRARPRATTTARGAASPGAVASCRARRVVRWVITPAHICGGFRPCPSSTMTETDQLQLVHHAATLIICVQAWIPMVHKRAVRHAAFPRVIYGPMIQRDKERIANLNNIYNCNDVEAIQMLWMRRAPFYALVKTFRERGLLTDSIHTSIEEQVAMFLHVVGHNQRFRVIHNTFRRSTETISRYFQQDCIGAIDGTHVTAKVPGSMSAAFRVRKHYTSQNVLAAVDFDMRFTYVLAGWEVSAHDASIMADSLSRPDGLQIPDGKFYLGDAGYACRPGILPPFRKTRYHLNEFSTKHRPLNARELFNLRHSCLRVTIERAFAALKNRFKVLDQKPFHTFDTQVKLVLACCILHNWILGWSEDEFFEEVVSFDEVETGHGVKACDNDAWKVKRQEWADAMWEARGNTTI